MAFLQTGQSHFFALLAALVLPTSHSILNNVSANCVISTCFSICIATFILRKIDKNSENSYHQSCYFWLKYAPNYLPT